MAFLTGQGGARAVTNPAQGESPERTKARETFQKALLDYVKEKDLAKARQGFLEAIQLDESYALPRYNLGVLAEAEEKWDEAIKWFGEFLRLDQSSRYADKARKELVKIRRIRDLDRTPEGKLRRRYDDLLARARTLLAAGLPKEAIAAAAAAAQMDDSRWEAYALAAGACSDHDLVEEAASFMRKAIFRAPEDKKRQLQKALSQILESKK